MDSNATEGASSFEFITDARFRQSLESDYQELMKSFEGSSWKAVHVLAGSIVEAVLVNHLIITEYQKKTGKDPLKMMLGDAADACKTEGVLSQKAYDLSSVIRAYRNLIHPGRVIRLGEKIDRNSAVVARALVDIVIDEVVAARKKVYGFTAEQLLLSIA
jgi:hypothetical protein